MDQSMAGRIRDDVRDRYRTVAACASGQFPYPVGRASMEQLGYDPAWLARLPAAVLDRFVGVGNPFAVHRPEPGECVVDLGCGAGCDTLVAAELVGPRGRVAAVDLSPAMLEVARAAAPSGATAPIDWREASIEALPFTDGTFDLAVSNGVLNLIPDKDAAFREVARVLRPGGVLAAADLVVVDTVPAEVLAAKDAWSS